MVSHTRAMPPHDLPRDFAPSNRRDFPGRRWLLVALRSLHLVGVVLVGSALLTGQDEYRRAAAALAQVIAAVDAGAGAQGAHG